MKRSAGITITAVIDFVGSAFLFFCAAISLVAVALQSIIPASANSSGIAMPPMVKYVQIFSFFVLLALVACGVATGVGLLRLREWARISQMIFAGLLALMGFSVILLFMFIDLPVPANDRDPELTRHIFQLTRVFISIFYGGLGALGVWWLYYFGKRSVRDEFRSGARAITAAYVPGAVPAVQFGQVPGPMNSGRPVSISVIAALMLIGVLSFPVIVLTHTPMLLFGYPFYGGKAALVALLWFALQAAAAYGLLKLRLWGWTLAIVVLALGLLNTLAVVVIPGGQARFDGLMQQIYSQWGFPSNIPTLHLPVALMILPAVPVILVELWFVITRKPAFVAAEAKISAR
jgi:hypothetical protein